MSVLAETGAATAAAASRGRARAMRRRRRQEREGGEDGKCMSTPFSEVK